MGGWLVVGSPDQLIANAQTYRSISSTGHRTSLPLLPHLFPTAQQTSKWYETSPSTPPTWQMISGLLLLADDYDMFRWWITGWWKPPEWLGLGRGRVRGGFVVSYPDSLSARPLLWSAVGVCWVSKRFIIQQTTLVLCLCPPPPPLLQTLAGGSSLSLDQSSVVRETIFDESPSAMNRRISQSETDHNHQDVAGLFTLACTQRVFAISPNNWDPVIRCLIRVDVIVYLVRSILLLCRGGYTDTHFRRVAVTLAGLSKFSSAVGVAASGSYRWVLLRAPSIHGGGVLR